MGRLTIGSSGHSEFFNGKGWLLPPILHIVLNLPKPEVVDLGLRVLVFKGLVPAAVGGHCKVRGLTPWKQGSLPRLPLRPWGSLSQTLW